MFSNTTNLLGGHDFENAAHREKIAGILDIPVQRIPQQNSWAYPEIIEGILRGKIRGLWVVCTNTAHSWINQNTCRDILNRLDFLVVQDMYDTTETAQLADLVLPAAAWGEKEGTFINSERRLGLIKKVVQAPGEALADFLIFKLVAHYWGCANMFEQWREPEDVFRTLRECSRGQPCDITGIRDYRMIDACGGIQWPFPQQERHRVARGGGDEQGHVTHTSSLPPSFDYEMCEPERRLFQDGRFYHPDGRAKFLFDQPSEMPEPPNQRYPYLLLTGRGTAAQWHTQTRTGKSAVLRTLAPPQPYVEINPQDARRERIRPNQWVIVESQRGRARAKAFLTHSVPTGQLFMAMHYGVTNQLTHAHFDPHSRQPSYKDCAVRLRAVEPWDD